MKPVKFYVKEILEEVCGRLSSLSKNVYPEERPLATQKQMADLIVVSLPYGFRDHNVTQTGLLRVEFIVRNKQNGVVNVEKLQELLDSFTEMMPFKFGRFFIHTPKLALKGSDNAGFTIWCVHCNIEIDTTDRFSDV